MPRLKEPWGWGGGGRETKVLLLLMCSNLKSLMSPPQFSPTDGNITAAAMLAAPPHNSAKLDGH